MRKFSPTCESRGRARGQGMAEYIIVVFLVALCAIGIVGLFGDNIRSLFGDESSSLAGRDAVANTGIKRAPIVRGSLKSLPNYNSSGSAGSAGSAASPPPLLGGTGGSSGGSRTVAPAP